MNELKKRFEEFKSLRSQTIARLDEEISTMKQILTELNGGSAGRPMGSTSMHVREVTRGKSRAILGRRRWSKIDIDQLLHMVRSRPIPKMKHMCKALHRTPSALRAKVWELKEKGFNITTDICRHQKNTRKKRKIKPLHRWTKPEKEKIIAFRKSGMTYGAIAGKTGFRPKQVSSMLGNLKRNGL